MRSSFGILKKIFKLHWTNILECAFFIKRIFHEKFPIMCNLHSLNHWILPEKNFFSNLNFIWNFISHVFIAWIWRSVNKFSNFTMKFPEERIFDFEKKITLSQEKLLLFFVENKQLHVFAIGMKNRIFFRLIFWQIYIILSHFLKKKSILGNRKIFLI